MVIVGLLMLAGPVDVDRLERTLAERLLVYRRFRQRVETGLTGTWWCDDPDFDIAHHIKRIRLPAPGGRNELERFVADLAAQPLDPLHPLWQYHIVEDYEGGVALVDRSASLHRRWDGADRRHAVAHRRAARRLVETPKPMPSQGWRMTKVSDFRSRRSRSCEPGGRPGLAPVRPSPAHVLRDAGESNQGSGLSERRQRALRPSSATPADADPTAPRGSRASLRATSGWPGPIRFPCPK